jgi:hypothetical protein
MTDYLKLERELAGLDAKATPGSLETAEDCRDQEGVECPACGGEGVLDARDYCNFDGVAVGVQFFGIGSEFLTHEELWRCFTANRVTIRRALRLAAAVQEAERALQGAERGLLVGAIDGPTQWARDGYQKLADGATAALARIKEAREGK